MVRCSFPCPLRLCPYSNALDQYPPPAYLCCLDAIIQIRMSFHQLEAQAVLADADDNQKIAALLAQFGEMKGRLKQAEIRIAELTQENSKLKDENRKLEESNRQRHNHSHSHYIHAKQDHFLQKDSPIPFSQTHNSYFHAQQTKRKVINGFVAELTSQLENSEELLMKQRKMHEELRRSLQASNEEILKLKTANRALEAQLRTIMGENRQLLTELSQMQLKKDVLQGEFQKGMVELGCRKNAQIRRGHEIEEQFMLMDQIYRQIELQLSK